jgi:hypothetical protein
MRGLLGGDGGDGVGEFVVEPAQHIPYLGGLGDRLAEIMEGIGEFLEFGGVVDPTNQALINHEPLWIGALSDGWSSVDVGVETELAEDGVEEAPPFGIIRFDDVKHHRDMGLDVDRLEGRSWKRMNRGWWL